MESNGSQRVVVEGVNGERVPLEVVGQPALTKVAAGKRAQRKPAVGRGPENYPGLTAPLSTDVLKRRYKPDQFLDLITAIRDLDPMVSQGVWNYLRLLNPGHHLAVYRFDAAGSEVEEKGAGQAAMDELVRRVGHDYGGGLDQLHNVLGLTLMTQGANALEVTPTADLADIEDWYWVDPALLAYQRQPDGTLLLGQLDKAQNFIPVNPDTVFYQPLDPDGNDPYGRFPLLGSIQAVLSKHSLLADVRAVAHNQGFPRIDVSVIWEAIEKAAPPHLKAPGAEASYAAWADTQLNSIVSEYEKLAIDDTFVHYDWVDLNMVGSTAPGSTTFNFKELDRILTEQLNSALKTLPILNGTMDADQHGHGSIQWQIQVAGVEALQRIPKRIIEKAGNISLQILGIPGHCKMVYDPIRSVDRLYEGQADLFEAKSLTIDVMMGWKSNDEAALERTGHLAVGPIPIQAPQGTSSDINANNTGDKSKGAGGDAPTTPKDAEKGQSGQESYASPEAWELLDEPAVTFSGRMAGDFRALEHDEIEPDLVEFERQAAIIFYGSMDDLVRELNAEGWEIRDVPKDVADYVFGLRYSRQMKALLRDAIRRGMESAGDANPVPAESLVDRIWNENRQYVIKIREELKAALRAGQFNTIDDIRHWFDDNAWREQLMGRYLAKQGITGGYAFTLTQRRGSTLSFRWRLGIAEHCADCLSRNGKRFTYAELLSVGLPGSSALECGAKCHCSLDES